MILGSPSIWWLLVILNNLDGTLYSWRLSGSMTHSTKYQFLEWRMRILRRDQSYNWKNKWHRIIHKKKVPERLWDYGLVWISETGKLSVSSSRDANGITPLGYIFKRITPSPISSPVKLSVNRKRSDSTMYSSNFFSGTLFLIIWNIISAKMRYCCFSFALWSSGSTAVKYKSDVTRGSNLTQCALFPPQLYQANLVTWSSESFW